MTGLFVCVVVAIIAYMYYLIAQLRINLFSKLISLEAAINELNVKCKILQDKLEYVYINRNKE